MSGARARQNETFAIQVQRWLVSRGHALEVDGYAGEKTALAFAQETGSPVPQVAPAQPTTAPSPQTNCWSARDLSDAAAICGVTPRHVRAVATVEAPRGPFDDAGHPTLLFERHLFHRLTGGRFDGVAPDLSDKVAGGYGTYAAQPSRLARARMLDDEAAVKATSWGAFQILGRNHEPAGFDTVAEFEAAMRENPRQQLLAFARFLRTEKLADHLLAERWHDFARGYNGPQYAKHGYHQRLVEAFSKTA